MKIQRQPTRSTILSLLTSVGLPTSDLDDNDFSLFYAGYDDQNVNPSGVIGMEVHGNDGLLRSLAVSPSVQGKGYGGALVSYLEHQAKSKGLERLYLLTTTAVCFFEKLGYSQLARLRVPEHIQQTTEFSSICPDEAIVMQKKL